MSLFVASQVGGFFRRFSDHEPSKVSEGPIATYEWEPRTPRPSISNQQDAAQRTEHPWVFMNIRKSGGSVRIKTWTSLRGVNGSSTEKRVQRPNKTFEDADIRGIGMARDVIVPRVVE